MSITTMTHNAVRCVASARPRMASPVRVAVSHAPFRGTAVSADASFGPALAAVGAPITWTAALAGPNYPTTDVVRSRQGRPPV